MSISEMRNTTTGKVVGFLAALTLVMSLVFGATYAPAQAQTEEELLALITQLTAQIEALQSQLGGGTTVSGDFDYVFLNDLGMGSTGTDVMMLQTYLNMNAATQVATTGAGSPGMESSYYGSLTANAVSRYQEVNAASVLTPLGLASGTGYFGPSTRAHMNGEIAVGEAEGPTTPGTPSTGDLEGDEAVIFGFDVNDGDDDDLTPGQTGEVAEIEFEVRDGDLRVDRLDLTFDGGGERADRVFETITVYGDGEELTEMDVDDRDDWSRDGDEYTVRLSGLNYVVREDDEALITIEVTTQENARVGDTWTVTVPAMGMRTQDALGLLQYAGGVGSASFDVVAFGTVGFDVSDNNTPDDKTVTLDADVNDVHLLSADVEVEGQGVIIEDVTVLFDSNLDFTAGGGVDADDVEDIVARAILELDGDEFTSKDVTIVTAANGTFSVTFDVDEAEFDLEDEFEMSVFVDLSELEGALGTTFTGSTLTVASVQFEGEGVDGDLFDETETTTFATVATLAAGDIAVNVTDGPDVNYTAATVGTISFEIEVENESGAALEDVDDVTNWDFDVKGYGGLTIAVLNPVGGAVYVDNTDLADGASMDFLVEIDFTSRSASEDKSIEIELIDGSGVYYTISFQDAGL